MSDIGIGTVIASLRKQKGITQEVLANKVGVSTQAVSKWETGATDPDLALIPVIADFFGVSIDSIFGRSTSTATNDDPGSFVRRIVAAHPDGNVMDVFLDCCWDMQMDYFDPMHESTEAQRNSARSNESHSSRIVLDTGFTSIRSGLGFVAVSDPPNGWISFLNNNQSLSAFFADISAPGFFNTLVFLIEKHSFSFTPSVLQQACNLDETECSHAIHTLVKYRLVKQKDVDGADGPVACFDFNAQRLPLLFVVLVYAQEFINEKGGYYGYCWNRRSFC